MKQWLFLAVLAAMVSCAGSDAAADYPPPAPRKEYPVNEIVEYFPDRINQGTDKSAWVVSPTEIRSTYGQVEKAWVLEQDISSLPSFSAPSMPLLEAVTNMALEESLKNIIPSGVNAGAFMAGAKWPGTWTRDISYAIHLSLAMILPEASERSLRVKTNSMPEVIQDTGTGGSWPVSTDRTVWSLAAYELYLSTGDATWLDNAYTILKNTANRDRIFTWDADSGLYRGETSFMDWREQTYPKWMTPVDIAESKALGTTLLHINTLRVLERMGAVKRVPAAEIQQWKRWADAAQAAVNQRLWMEDKGYYSAYEYGPWQGGLKTDKSDTLANSLGVLLGMFPASRSAAVMERLPVVPFGPPIIYPQIPNIPSYHNKGIWPFVTAYYSWAGGDAGNLEALAFGIRSNLRAAALFLTHKENMVYSNGHHMGTQVNSDRQLWSVAGWLGQMYRGIMGIRLEASGLRFRPAVPEGFEGPFVLKNFPWRNSKLNITVTGSGNIVSSLKVDGVERGASYVLPANLNGEITVEIVLNGTSRPSAINMGDVAATGTRDTMASVETAGSTASVAWQETGYDVPFKVFRRGTEVGSVQGTNLDVPLASGPAQSFTVQGYPEDGYPANLSAYVLAFPQGSHITLEAEAGSYPEEALVVPEEDMGQTGSYVDLGEEKDVRFDFPVDIPQAGRWAVRFRYANGNGPISTDNKCALRTLLVDGRPAGKILLPQTGNWSDWMMSTAVFANLTAGRRTISFVYTSEDTNMNGESNQAIVDSLELILW